MKISIASFTNKFLEIVAKVLLSARMLDFEASQYPLLFFCKQAMLVIIQDKSADVGAQLSA